ncbi:fasciclin-1 isoform X2 [Patella vulgata]|uniref:fasciclin-1 isoform X2 n=1 Tax=Patella vulgata TaxID=6465 RepID=UPI0024A850E4|nr:fasciclin-1 isoform X2 [Patella vulgata]
MCRVLISVLGNLVVLFLLSQHVVPGNSEKVWDIIREEYLLNKVARFIANNTVLSQIFDKENITVFIPYNAAYFNYNPFKYGYRQNDVQAWKNILLYGSLDGAIYLKDMKENVHLSSRLGSDQYLYFNYYSSGKDGYHTVNGARIVRGNIRGDNGIVHIIDRVIAPYCSHKNLPDYLSHPDIPSYSFSSIIKAKIVVPILAAETNRSDLFFTSFSPNDSFLYPMPQYGQDKLFQDWLLLQKVYKAHIIPYSVQFIPTVGTIPDFTTSAGDKITFTRHKGSVYVSNNRVRARIVQANIPVTNGVLHVIDDLLHYIYQNILQKMAFLPDASNMLGYMNRLPDAVKQSLQRTNETFTVFVPTNWAFGKIPITQQEELRRNDEEGMKTLNYLIQGHIISGVDLSSSDLEADQTLTTIDDKIVSIIHVQGETYIESGTVRAKIEVMDIGCTNGVIHFISNVLFMRNFTLWEAMENIPQLSIMYSFALEDQDIEDKLLSDNTGPRTVFMAGNSVLEQADQQVIKTLRSFSYIVHEAIKGQIVQGIHMSSDIAKSVQVGTMAGKTLTLFKDKETGEFEVEGSHVRARVIVKDIWCSNGVLHIVDDILHLPIRNIVQEIAKHSDLTFTSALITAVQDLNVQLSNLSENYTIFIPRNDAYSKLQWSTIDAVLKDIPRARKILQSHIISGVAKYIDEIRDREMLKADENVIYIIRKNGHVFAINNNLWARVIKPDIPASNGRIHVIDTIFYLPYMTIAEALENMEELKPFQDLMSLVPEFNDLITSNDNRLMTLFIPSGDYIQSLDYHKLDKIQKSPKILKRLYAGHVLPQARYDDAFLRKYPDSDYVTTRSALNVTITIRRSATGSFIDAGYEKTAIDLVAQGFAFTNGVIYIIESFLNYSPLTLLERLQSEDSIRTSIALLDLLVTPNVTDLLSRDGVTFTFLAPSDNSDNLMEFSDYAKKQGLSREDKLKVFWRHVINGSEVTYIDLKQGYVKSDSLPTNVTLQTANDDVMFSWKDVQGRIIKANLLASNGIIHVIDNFLYSTSSPTTTAKTSSRVSDSVEHRTPPATTPNAQPVLSGVSLRLEKMLLILTVMVSWTSMQIYS